jgi:hypothetical protein
MKSTMKRFNYFARTIFKIALCYEAVMVLRELSAHALVAGSTNSSGRWLSQSLMSLSVVTFINNVCLEELLETRILYFSMLYVMFGL